jgi:HD-GYP domain-containing protein (c-di-GMP phosphodiesterase class II)
MSEFAMERELSGTSGGAFVSNVKVCSLIGVLVNAMELKDPYTASHSERVAKYSMMMGNVLDFPESMMTLLYRSAIIHDIGKLGVPNSIIEKPSLLDVRERIIMNSHPVMAIKILSSDDCLKDIAEVVLYHHERHDGKGYYLFQGSTIPLLSRVIAIADAYDAMRTDRPYRRAMMKSETIDEILINRDIQFDSNCVDAFMKTVDELE